MKMYLKNNKNNNRLTIYIVLFVISFICSIKLIINDNTKEYFLSSFLKEISKSDNYIYEDIKNKLISPKYILYNGLNKIVDKNNLSVFSSIIEDGFSYENASSSYVEDPNVKEIYNPLVYIYNSHQLEEYKSVTPYDYSVTPNVMIASYILREKLEDLGITALVETNNIKEYLDNNNMNYNSSYHASEYFARLAKEKYPSIKYMIDLHRDSASYAVTYSEFDNLPYARVLVVKGFEHTQNNEGFAESINEILDRDYYGLSRGILDESDDEPVYGVYNPNLDGKGVLLEVGGVDNKIEEVNNTLEVIAKALKEIISKEVGV